jgi:hypothetical protein
VNPSIYIRMGCYDILEMQTFTNVKPRSYISPYLTKTMKNMSRGKKVNNNNGEIFRPVLNQNPSSTFITMLMEEERI